MKNRWLNLLFILLCVLIVSLSWHLFIVARTTAAASLIINILKPLNILLFMVLFYILVRALFKLYLGRRNSKPGFRLQTKLVLAILPLTLIPSIILFTLATRFVDDILVDLVIDSNKAKIVENSEALRGEYLDEIGTLYLSHADPVLDLFHGESARAAVEEYLARFGLEGVEYYVNDLLMVRVMVPGFPEHRLARVQEGASPSSDQEPVLFDDGFLVLRYPAHRSTEALHFVFTRETPFTERFQFIRDSYAFLKHTKKKTEKVKGLNQGILLVTTLAIIFGGIWIGHAFARRFLSAFRVLIDGAEQVSKGNFETQLELKTGDEIEDVVKAFNSMTCTLKNNQAELEQKAKDLQSLNAELSGQIEYSQTILHQVNTGILSTDEDGRVRTHNPAVLNILNLEEVPDHAEFQALLNPEIHYPLIRQWQDFQDKNGRPLFRELEFEEAEEQKRYVACSMVPLKKEGQRFGRLIVLDDLTQLLNAQKLAAWREVARRVAHEIKNPLTPIQLSIQRIRRKAQREAPDLRGAIESAHETIMSETDLLKNLVNEFSTFARMPSPVKTETDLSDLVVSVCASYKPVFPKICVRFDLPPDPVKISCDPTQIRQVLSNLIHNAADASKPGDKVVVGIRREEANVILTVTDKGVGIPDSEKEKVFVPYYSKSPKGTGLGLAIVKRIVEDHGGRVTIESDRPKGTRFSISLPD